MRPWIASLPQHVNLPMFYASVADLEACEDADLIREALSIRESAEAVYEVHLPCCAELAPYAVMLNCYLWACIRMDVG